MKSPLSRLGQRTVEPPITWLMRQTLAHPGLISLAAGFTDNATLPVAETRRLVARVLANSSRGRPALQYGTTAGLPELRRLTADRVRRLDGVSARAAGAVRYEPEGTVITSGSQQLLYMLVEVLCDPGDIVLVEDPTYFVFLGILQSHGVEARGVRMESDGISPAALEATLERLRKAGELRRVKVLYLVTYYQNPTGITTSRAKKAAVLEVLRRYERWAGHPLYLVEDAAYRELRFAGEEVVSGLVLPGGNERVAYVGTYSKPFATGVRVGFGLLPDRLRRAVLRVKGNHDFGSASLLQHLLVEALRSGVFDRHLAGLRRRYAAKAAAMVAAMKASFPSAAEWQEPQGGLYVWARLPGGLRSGLKSSLFRRAIGHEVLYVPGALCYAEDPSRRRPDHEMRLSFGGETLPEIREGIRRLGAALHEGMRPGRRGKVRSG